MIERFPILGNPAINTTLVSIRSIASIVFDNIPLLFAMGVAYGMSKKDKGIAVFSSVIGYLVMLIAMNVWLNVTGNLADPDIMSQVGQIQVLGIQTLNINALGGIIAGSSPPGRRIVFTTFSSRWPSPFSPEKNPCPSSVSESWRFGRHHPLGMAVPSRGAHQTVRDLPLPRRTILHGSRRAGFYTVRSAPSVELSLPVHRSRRLLRDQRRNLCGRCAGTDGDSLQPWSVQRVLGSDAQPHPLHGSAADALHHVRIPRHRPSHVQNLL